jgi:hypothetical protein
MTEPLRTYPTIACIDRYQMIAELNLNRFDELDEEVAILKDQSAKILAKCDNPQSPPFEYFEVHSRLDPMNEERRQCFVISVMFTLLFFETYIYSYAASHVGELYFKENFAKLTLAEKWALIPQHVNGTPLSTKKPGYAALMQLCEDESCLKNIKVGDVEFEGAVISKDINTKKISLIQSVRNCKIALADVIEELDELTAENADTATDSNAVNLNTQLSPSILKKSSSVSA